jgi:type IV secretory pathway TraG/TraD family ATPase VirD4
VPGFEALAQNCNVAVIMAQGELANAEMCADHIGLERQQQFSQQVREGALSDAGSLSEVRDYIISPDELRKLTIGQAIVKVSKPENRVSWVKIIPRDAKLKPRH